MREDNVSFTDAVRDEHGYGIHELIPESDDEFIDLSKIESFFGYEFSRVYFEDDASEEMQEKYYGDGDPDISGWEITRPNENAILLGVSDSGDGPIAYFAQKVQITPADIADNERVERPR